MSAPSSRASAVVEPMGPRGQSIWADPPVKSPGSTSAAWPRGHAFGFGLLDDGSYRFWLPRWLVLARWPLQKGWREDRKRLARLRALYWTVVRQYESELCGRCGGPVGVVFHAPDDLWELVSGYARFPDGEAAPGVLCIKCVDDLAEPQIEGYLTWTCAVTE